MKQKAKKLLKHPLIYGSGIVFFGNMFANFFHFLFNLFMSRNLPIAEYGVLASINSLISFPVLFSAAIAPLVIRFSGDYFAHKQYDKLKSFYITIARFTFFVAITSFILFLFFIPQLGQFFHIKNTSILFLADCIIFFSLIMVVNQAFLQAKLAFGFQVIVNVTGALVKVLLGVVLVMAGFAAKGAVGALLVAFILSYLVSFFPLKIIFDKKSSRTSDIRAKELFKYGVPSALTLFGLTSFIATDILLVKHFFSPEQAGLYAGLSLIGRVIFFLSAPIGTVMFPLIVQKHSKHESFSQTFFLSLLLVLLPSVAITIFYILFPQFTILFFLKKVEYLAVTNLLFPFGILLTLYSLLSLISSFYLSIKKTKIFIPIILGAFMQIVLIFLYHETFLQIIYLSISIVFLLVLCLLIYYPYATKK